MMAGAFVVGSYFTLSQVLIPMIKALTETTTQMPSEVAFNRLAESGLAGHDTGGGATFVLSSEVKLATSSAWWTADYAQKKQLTVRNLSSVPLATQSATTQQITINTKELYDAGKLQTNCEDLRVVFVATQSGNLRRELPRSFYPASGAATCATSTATTVAFPLQEPLWTGGSDSNYEVYYGNSSATDPGYLDQGYSITRADNSTASATLVCPFNGTTTCVGGETPTTQTGAIRYSGGSAMSFDGKDEISIPNISEMTTGGGSFTAEGWFYLTRESDGVLIGKNGWTNGLGVNYGSFFCGMVNTDYQYFSTTAPLTYNQWVHLACQYDSSTGSISLYKNGVLASTTTYTGSNIRDNGTTLYLFQPRVGNTDVAGYSDEIRLSTTTRYTSNFTPQTTPFEPDQYTKLLLHFDENGDDPRNTGKAIDSSGNGNHGTITGAKYVSGLVGVDNSSSSTGAIPASTYASHQGVFIEEGTTNLITNPSFENATSATLNWGTNYFNYATASATFTPSMAKRNSAGPFAAGPMVQGLAGTSNTDTLTFPRGNEVSGRFYQNFDVNQGSIVFWITPEWNGNDGSLYRIFDPHDYFRIYKSGDGRLYFSRYTLSTSVDVSSWVAGSTYSVIVRWDNDLTIDGTNKLSISVNDVTTYGGGSGDPTDHYNFANPAYIGTRNYPNDGPANAIIEGLTIYRRPLYDGQYGIDVGNGDEIAQIYNSGTGRDPTLITGSWDVVFALPTNASTGTLTTGTGNAWSHPHSSNLLYTSTANTGGFMMSGAMNTDGFGSIGSVSDIASIKFDDVATHINAGSDSSLDDLHDGAFTAEAWVLGGTSGAAGTIVGKGAWASRGWSFGTFQSLDRIDVQIRSNGTSINTSTANSVGLLNNQWHHVAVTYDDVGDRVAKIWLDGVLVKTSNALTGTVNSDATDDLILGVSVGNNTTFNGNIAWTRISNSVRYTTTFTPPSRFSPPAGDINTVAQYNMNEGVGTTVSNNGGANSCGGSASNCNGTLTIGSGQWNEGGALSTSQKIFAGGYKFTSSGPEQGIKYTLSSQPVGRDYVVRAIAHSDGTSIPKIQIWDTVNNHEVTQLTGTSTSTRTNPDVLLFTFELPYVAGYSGQPGYEWVTQDSNQFEVRLINTQSSGTTYWHQVEVYENKANNPSFSRGTGSPWCAAGWNCGPYNQSDWSADAHSGQHSAHFVQSDSEYRYRWLVWGGFNYTKTVNKFYNIGHFSKSGANAYVFEIDAYPTYIPIQKISTAPDWQHKASVIRQSVSGGSIRMGGIGTSSSYYFDDFYIVEMSDISLTVTPASQANSTEDTGLRVDGADTLTQPITGLSADRGVVKFKFTPRHSIAVADKFGASFPVIVAIGSGNDRIELYKGGGNSVGLQGYFNAAAVTASWNSPTFVAGSTYNIEIRYRTGGNLELYVDNVQVATASGVGTFGTIPTTAYFGANSIGANQYDGTITSFVALTPTENTTAPYYKFGSKSVRLVNAGSMPDEYTIAIDPNSTATHTLSAYVYDGTSGNVGGTVASTSAKLVFGGNVVTPSAYTDMGGGWWRLTYSAATTDASLLYGVQAQAGKTLYVDGIQLEAKAYATTYADGSLGSGYSWSGGANESNTVRTVGHIGPYSQNNSIGPNNFTASIWVSPFKDYRKTFSGPWNYSDGFVTIQNINNTSRFRFALNQQHPGNNQALSFQAQLSSTTCCSVHEVGANIWASAPDWIGKWWHLVVTHDGTTIKIYKNGTQLSSNTYGSELITDWGSNPQVYFGTDYLDVYGDFKSNATISEARIYNRALTASEISSLYYSGLATHSSGSEAVDRYQASGTYTSPVIDLSANGAWGTIPWSATNALNGGGINYFTRTSMDNVSWSSWAAVTGSVGEGSWTGGIASDPRRYLQWKADLTSSGDKSQTPVITAMSTTYVEDSTPPANPAQVALGYANHASSSATLTSNEWYNYATPKFTWEAGLDDPAAGQSSSGIDGYHVLLTTDQNASPSANLASPCYRFSESDDRVFSVGTTPDTCELSDADYYLRMQTKDNSGNVSDPVTLFTYKYDSTAPRSPVSVSSTTVGYTSQNEFSFYWPAASDQGLNQSGLAYYEYKTGATEGPYSTWTKSNEPGDPLVTLASNITAYQEGQNFFFVRTVDFAGNVSAEISNLGVSPFYYNESAPTAPVNVVISPVTSSDAQALENIFTVTWDKPASYSGELAKYYYCVNCTPSVETMTETTNSQTADRTLTNIALATQQGKNTFYLVAEDNNINTDTGRGNVNFEAYATAEFYASTIAPGAPTNLTISDASDRDAEVWRLTLAWKQAVTGGTPNFYAIHRSTDGTTFTKIGETTSTAYTDADLTQSQEYSYKVFAIDNANSTSLSSNIVTLAPEGKYTTPPLAGGTPNVAVGSTVATITWSTGRIAYGAVEYGKTTSYESSVAETVAVGNHSIKLTGLTPGTVYHYRVQALDDSILMGYDREIAYSSDYTFTTSALPTISNVEVTDLTLASAIINWSAVSLSSATIEYGESTAYGASVSVGVGSSGTYSTKLSGLKDSVTYHFRIRAVDIDGTDITSDDYTFTTLTFPKVTAVVFKTDQAQNATAINVAWSTNVPTTASVEYQAVKIDPSFASQSEINYSNSSVLQALSQTELARLPVVPLSAPQYLDRSTISNRHVVQITNLSDSSLYVFTIRGRDEYGNQAVSDPIRYVTGADTKPPAVENLVIETPIVGEGVESKAEIVLSFTTDEPAFSQVLWGAGTGSEYPQATQTSSEATTDHMIVLRDLKPTATYHLKIKTTDQSENISETEDTVVVTPTAQAAAFELILKNLEGIFGFLGLQ